MKDRRENEMNDIKKISVVVVGCGDRSTTYLKEGVLNFKEMEIVAAIDPNPERLRYMQEVFQITPEQCYTHMDQVLSQGKIADCAIVGTMDQYHLETSLPFLEQGYDMLLEKPVVNNKEDLLKIRDTAKKSGSRLMICHVLRYAPFYKKIKELIMEGAVGEVMNIQTSERVGAFHSSVSYIRGKWNSTKECNSSFLLAKCCHDIDLLCWLNNGTTPVNVSSMGGRNYFIEEKAPKGSGNRCLVDCPKQIREKCIYDAQNMYLDNCQIPQYPWQCTGKNWQDVTEEEKIESLKTYNPHGQCIYKAGGDIVDHQNVMVEFENGSTAVHTLNLGSMRPGRSIWIQGTEGEIEGWVNDDYVMLRKYDRKTSCYLEEKVMIDNEAGIVDAHFGGDRGLVREFCNMMLGKKASVSRTIIDDSIVGHLLCYAADEAMEKGIVVEITDK